MKTSKKPYRRKRAVLHIGRFEVNLNSVLTTAFGSLACILLGWALTRLGTLTTNWNSIYKNFPQVQKDVEAIKKEQDRIRQQYAPPVH